MKAIQLAALMGVVALLLVGMTALIYSAYMVPETFAVPYSVKIVNESAIGFDASGGAFKFGKMGTNAGRSTRFFNVSNPHDYPVTVHYYADGPVGPYIHFPDGAELNASQTRSFTIYLEGPQVQAGNYTGTVYFSMRRA